MTCRSYAALLVAAPLFLAGCEAQQLYIASHTVIGVNASVNQARSAGKLMIGYDRDFAVVIPKSVDRFSSAEEPNADGTKKKVVVKYRDAMSAMSCTDMEVDGIFMTRFSESIATGYAAENFASKLALQGASVQAEKFFSCFDASSTGTPQK